MNEHYLRNVIEAALLAAGRPVPPDELIQLFDESARPTNEQMRAAIDALSAEYAQRGIELKETASGVRVQVRRELAGEVSRLWRERPPRYSRALLETLALIAYRQPITRGEIEAVRGVAVNPNIVKTLLERNWVRIVGHRDVPGRPELLGTTRDFLDYFGLKSLEELPPLAQLKAIGDINLQLDLRGEPAAKAEGESPEAGERARAGQPAQGAAARAEPWPEEAGESLAASADAGEAGEEALLEGAAAGAAVDGDGAESAAPASAGIESAVEDDEESDESDELSAEGGDSHELVAAPRDNGD